MNSTREYSAEHNPDEASRAKLGTHDSSEDRTKSGNIEKLYQVELPGGQLDVVDAIIARSGRRRAVIRSKNAVHISAIEPISHNQSKQSYRESNHRFV